MAEGLDDAWDSTGDIADFLRHVLHSTGSLGWDHPEAMALLHHLANALWQGGEYAGAERLDPPGAQ
jgi:hypothetical protein